MLNNNVQALKELAQSLNRAHDAVSRESCDLSILIKNNYGNDLKPSQFDSICEDLGVNFHTVNLVAERYFRRANVSTETEKMRQTAENLQYELTELHDSIREFTSQIVARDGRDLSEEGVINVCTNFGINSLSYEVWSRYKLFYKKQTEEA